MTNKAFDLSLKCPFTMLVSGPSGCGKSTFVRELIGPDKNIYSKPLGRVVWFYKTYQDIYEAMRWTGEVEQFVEGMCTMEWISENVDKDENCTIVIDDMALQATTDTAQIFTVGSHHNRVNVIFICQNIFTKNDHFREMSLNATYLILFKNVRDKLQISTFAKQFLPGKTKEFAAIYKEATKKPHSYLMLDTHQKTNDAHRILANYLQEEGDPIELFEIKQ